MLKLNCGFSRKVGEANYGSRGASVNLELEIATETARDADGLQERIRRLFALAKKAVDDELNGSADIEQPAARQPGRAANGGNASPPGDRVASPPPSDSGPAATNKQVKLIMDLGRARKMAMSAIERLCQDACGAGDVYSLTKRQASAVIDRLKANDPAKDGG